MTRQQFYRYYSVSLAEAGAKPGTLRGHYNMALIGLDANTVYGNTKEPDSLYPDKYGYDSSTRTWWAGSYLNAVDGTASNLYKKGVRKNTKIDVRRLQVGVALHLKDSNKAVKSCKAGVDPNGPDGVPEEISNDKSACNVAFPVVQSGWGNDFDFVTAAVPDFRTGVEPGVVSSVSKLPA